MKGSPSSLSPSARTEGVSLDPVHSEDFGDDSGVHSGVHRSVIPIGRHGLFERSRSTPLPTGEKEMYPESELSDSDRLPEEVDSRVESSLDCEFSKLSSPSS